MLPDTRKVLFQKMATWSLVVLGVFSISIALLDNLMVYLFLPHEEVAQHIRGQQLADQLPAFSHLLFTSLDAFLLLAVIASAITIVSSTALIIRKKWAKTVLLVLMSLGIGWNLGSLLLQVIAFNTLPGSAIQENPDFKTMQNIIFGAALAMSLAVSALFLWLVAKLRKRKVFKDLLSPA